ncbi:pyrroloquinoline quinone precursor peptide PqqA [Streptomyces sp. NPDC052610]
MNETKDQTRPSEQTLSQDSRSTWQTPDLTVIDTALEVTAYSLNSR